MEFSTENNNHIYNPLMICIIYGIETCFPLISDLYFTSDAKIIDMKKVLPQTLTQESKVILYALCLHYIYTATLYTIHYTVYSNSNF